MLKQKKLILLGVAIIVVVIYYVQVLSTKWVDVRIKHYDGKISTGQEFDPTLLRGTERRKGRKVRAYFISSGVHPVVKVYLDGNIVISHKKRSDGENVELWRLEGSLDGGMRDVIPGGDKIIEGTSHHVNGWTIEWWKHPTSPVEAIIITNPVGKSRTFRIEWSPK